MISNLIVLPYVVACVALMYLYVKRYHDYSSNVDLLTRAIIGGTILSAILAGWVAGVTYMWYVFFKVALTYIIGAL